MHVWLWLSLGCVEQNQNCPDKTPYFKVVKSSPGQDICQPVSAPEQLLNFTIQFFTTQHTLVWD